MAEKKIILKKHYIKDLSFENPNFIKFEGRKQKIKIENFNFKINSKFIENNLYEIEMIISTQKILDGKTLLVFDFTYAGFFQIMDENKKYQLVDGPSLIYPYAKNILSEIFKGGGFSQIDIPNIDFLNLYKKGLT